MGKTNEKRATELRELAAVVRDNPSAREAIAKGFELIADAMAPCEDCQRVELGEGAQGSESKGQAGPSKLVRLIAEFGIVPWQKRVEGMHPQSDADLISKAKDDEIEELRALIDAAVLDSTGHD